MGASNSTIPVLLTITDVRYSDNSLYRDVSGECDPLFLKCAIIPSNVKRITLISPEIAQQFGIPCDARYLGQFTFIASDNNGQVLKRVVHEKWPIIIDESISGCKIAFDLWSRVGIRVSSDNICHFKFPVQLIKGAGTLLRRHRNTTAEITEMNNKLFTQQNITLNEFELMRQKFEFRKEQKKENKETFNVVVQGLKSLNRRIL